MAEMEFLSRLAEGDLREVAVCSMLLVMISIY